MKIRLDKFNPEWAAVFSELRSELDRKLLDLKPVIEHIGSTAVPGMAAKPIIDILAGLRNERDLDAAVEPLLNGGYIYYEKYNPVMPYRRFFVKLKSRPDSFAVPAVYRENDEVPNELNDYKMAHIHVLKFNSPHWIRHIAFRDYLRKHEDVREEYQELKLELSTRDWRDGNAYNAAKNEFIKQTEVAAVRWYGSEGVAGQIERKI